jgi:hypothetical protein
LFDPSLPDCAADPEGEALKVSFLNYRADALRATILMKMMKRGKCIPDSKPRDESYFMNPSFPPHDIKEFVENFQE